MTPIDPRVLASVTGGADAPFSEVFEKGPYELLPGGPAPIESWYWQVRNPRSARIGIK